MRKPLTQHERLTSPRSQRWTALLWIGRSTPATPAVVKRCEIPETSWSPASLRHNVGQSLPDDIASRQELPTDCPKVRPTWQVQLGQFGTATVPPMLATSALLTSWEPGQRRSLARPSSICFCHETAACTAFLCLCDSAFRPLDERPTFCDPVRQCNDPRCGTCHPK